MSYSEEVHKSLLDSNGIKNKLKTRKSQFEYSSIKKTDLQEFLDKGWEIQRKNKNTFRIKKLKSADIWFEDRIWALFARMGFLHMNADREFRLSYTKDNSIPGKQIDVFAADVETIFIIECKTSKKRRTESFQKDINEIKGIRGNIIPKVQSAFEGKQKIVWLFCTENLVLSKNDKGRLLEHNIFHLNQDDIRYYEQLIDQLGISAKYQLFARFFANQQIPEIKNRVPAIKGKMGGFTYYSFSIEPDTLLKLSYILHRINTSDETLNTYQRMVKKNRIKQINEFLDGENNFFPNSIIINIDTKKGKDLVFEPANTPEHDSKTKIGVLHLPKSYKSAYVIDGQHRLYGYGFNQYKCSHTIPVVAFENLPSDKQANLFVEINHKQKSVPANLLKSLDAELKWDSPIADDAIRALKSKLAQILNEREESPLYSRIIIGEEKSTQTKCITLTYIFDYGLNKTNLFGELKKRALIRTGPLYAGDLAEQTLEKSYQFFKL
ncbi:MAG: DGQHR domain-containing protein, partial [Candidatus Peribacteraceae bacterium]|nr:DGQHR domain-containing protein [Candidatus Peribacteraceae bacterium]